MNHAYKKTQTATTKTPPTYRKVITFLIFEDRIDSEMNLDYKAWFILDPHLHPHPQGKQKMYCTATHMIDIFCLPCGCGCI